MDLFWDDAFAARKQRLFGDALRCTLLSIASGGFEAGIRVSFLAPRRSG